MAGAVPVPPLQLGTTMNGFLEENQMNSRRQRVTSALLALAILVLPTMALPGLVPSALAAPAEASTVGTGPNNALAPTGDWGQLDAGQTRWYAFQYAGDKSQIQIQLNLVPAGSMTFAVWTPKEISIWGQHRPVSPIGRGSAKGNDGGTLVWSGNFAEAGIYYVVVDHAADVTATSYYQLNVNGTGVSFDIPAPVLDERTMPVPVQTPPKSSAVSELTGKLVFQTSYGGPFYSIQVDGTDLQRITNGIDPVWSPEGTQIAFVRWEDPRGVWLVNADGSNAHRIFDWSQTLYPSWSADGKTAGAAAERPAAFRALASGSRALDRRVPIGRWESSIRVMAHSGNHNPFR
jgi:hypothetical protein